MYDFVILGVPRSGRALHGYAMSEAYSDERLGGAPLDARRLYKTLKRLENARWITPVATADARAKVDYTIAARGVTVFDRWFCRVERDRLHAALDARVPFVGDVPPDLAARWAEQYERALCGVTPVSWTPDPFPGKRSPRCQSHTNHTPES